jgi:hypothetical protein
VVVRERAIEIQKDDALHLPSRISRTR